MRFFAGKDRKEIMEHQRGSTAEHYGWCLSQLKTQLDDVNRQADISKYLLDFQENMRQTEGTENMLKETEPLFKRLLDSDKINTKEIFNEMTNLCIPDVGYITSYSITEEEMEAFFSSKSASP